MEINENTKSLSIRGANLLYLLVLLLLVVIGRTVQEWDFNYGILITEICLVALPALAFAAAGRRKPREFFRLNAMKPVDVLLVVLIFICGYMVAAFVNLVGDLILSFFGQLIVPDIPIAGNLREYVVLLGVIALSAGICEELLFRGYIMKAYEGIGMWGSIILTALLFSMMHLNIQNIFATLYLGIMLGFVVYSTNSIFAGMLGHFLNNAVSVTIGYLVARSPLYSSMAPEAVKAGMTTPAILASLIAVGIFALAFGTVVVLCMRELWARSAKRAAVSPEERLGSILKNMKISWPLYVGGIIFLFAMVLEFVYIRTGAPLKLF